MRKKEEMQPEDIERVNRVINSGYNQKQRKPFSFWKIIGIAYGVVVIISLIALLTAKQMGAL